MKILKNTYELGRGFFEGFFASSTALRKLISTIKKGTGMDYYTLGSGLMLSVSAAVLFDPLAYYYQMKNIDERFPFVYLATNIASGIYEYFRYKKNKNGLLVPLSDLEKKVEKTKPRTKSPAQSPQSISNPWDIDIDEIQDARYPH